MAKRKLKDNSIDNSVKVKEIKDLISAWADLTKIQIKKGIDVRRYVYDSDYEMSQIQTKGSIRSAEKVTLSPLRTAVNRVKTDLRDLEPFFQVTPQIKVADDKPRKIFSGILDKTILHERNQSVLFDCFDDIVDVDVTVMRIDCDYDYNKNTKAIQKSIRFTRVTDLLGVYFDASVDIGDINEKGRYQGFSAYVDLVGDGKFTLVTDHFEKIYKTTTYGKRFDAGTGRSITEPKSKDKNVKYQVEIDMEEVDCIKHYVLHENEIVTEEVWPYNEFPYLLGLGVYVYDKNEQANQRLALAPFCEHVIPAQTALNYAATLNLYNIKMTRSTTKATYTREMVLGHEDKWKNRNAGEDDLTYNLIYGPDGSIIPIKPEFVPDSPPSAQITEAMNTYPTMINALLGTNMEQDITYNDSGEAIRQMQIVRHKNAKLYTDKYLEFLGALSKRLEYFIPAIYDEPQYITLDNYGLPQVVEINTSASDSLNIKKMFDTYAIRISVGSTPADQKSKTRDAINQIFTAYQGTPLGIQIQGNLADIYAASLDTPDADEIARRVKLAMPANIIQLERGKVTTEQLLNQSEQQQAQAQQQQAQSVSQQQAIDDAETQSKLITAQSKMKMADNKLSEVALDSAAETTKTLANLKSQ